MEVKFHRDFSQQYLACESQNPNTQVISNTQHSAHYSLPFENQRVPIIDAAVSCCSHEQSVQQYINDFHYPVCTRMFADFAPTTSVRIEEFVQFVAQRTNRGIEHARQYCYDIYSAAFKEGVCAIVNDADSRRPPSEVIKDVLTHPVDEIHAFLRSLLCFADNSAALFNVSQLRVMDPVTEKKITPTQVFSRATFNFINHMAHRPTSDLLAIASIICNAAGAVRGDYLSIGSSLLSIASILTSDVTSFVATTRRAALYNLSKMVTLRQVTRFLLLASLLLLAWKVGGAVFSGFARLFRISDVVPHSVRPDTIVVIILGVLTTWISGVYKSHVIVEFLRTTSLIGGGQFVFNTLNDCILFVTRLIADFATWLGLRTIANPLNDFMGKRTLDQYTRRGGKLSEVLPKINAFLGAKPIGISGPGTNHYINEGRELVHEIDQHLLEVTAVDGAGHLLSLLTRYRQQIVTAIESSVFSSENSFERCEPHFLYICGGPRMGKTMFTNSLISALRMRMSELSDSEGPIRHTSALARENRWVYSRNSDDAFFSNYNKQALVFYDDVFTANNSRETGPAGVKLEAELSEIQKLVSSQPYAPPMPEVGAGVPCPKGTYINPAFVVATSNFILLNTGCRSTDIIDDRISELVLTIQDKRIAKDSSFSHLILYKLNVSVSEFRAIHAQRGGWVAPYSPQHQFPTTIEQFAVWNMKDLFTPVSPEDLVESAIEKHEQKLLELQIRRQGALNIAHKIDNDYISRLENSYVNFCHAENFIPVDNFRARCLALGLTKALEGTRTSHGDRFRISADGPIIVGIEKGEIVQTAKGEYNTCKCPGGHTSNVLCPDFESFCMEFRFVTDSLASPVKPAPHYMLVGSHVERSDTPLPGDTPIQQLFAECMSSVLDIPCPQLPCDIGDKVDPQYSGFVLGQIGKSYRLGVILEAGKHKAFCVDADGDIVTVGHTRCYKLLTVSEHSDHATILQKLYANRSREQVAKITDDDILEVLNACSETFSAKHGLTEDELRFLNDDLYPNLVAAKNHEPTGQEITWVVQIRDSIDRVCAKHGLMLPRFTNETELKLQAFYAGIYSSYDRFAWRYLSQYLTRCVKIRLEKESRLRMTLTYAKDSHCNPTIKQLIISDPIRGLEMSHPHDTPLTVPHVIRELKLDALEGDELDGVLRTLPSLVNFGNVLLGTKRASWSTRLVNGATRLWHLLCEYKNVLLIGLAAFAGAFAIGSLAAIGKSLSKPNVIEHSTDWHRPPRSCPYPWPSCYHRLIGTIEHPDTAKKNGKCRLCGNLYKLTHSRFDENKEKQIIQDLYLANKKHPQVKNYLAAVLEFNTQCLDILELHSQDQVEQRLLKLISDRAVPWTATGRTRHLYIFRAWNCLNSRKKAIATIRKQSEHISTLLGGKRPNPIYRVDGLVFPTTCNIPTQEIECCPCLDTCTHTQEHAYYLPDEPVRFSAIDKAIATASSGMGFIMVNGCVEGRGCMLADGVLVTATHVLKPYIDREIPIHWRGQTRFTFYASGDRIQIIPDHDIIVVRVESDELPSARIAHLLSSDVPSVGSKVSLVKLSPDMSKTPIPAKVLPHRYANTPLKDYFLIDQHLEPGDSGSLVIQGGKIVGHYHGTAGQAGLVCHWPPLLEKVLRSFRKTEFFDSRFVQEVDDHGFAVIDRFPTKEFDSNPPTREVKTELWYAFNEMGILSVKRPASQSQEALEKSIMKWQPVEEAFDADYAMAASELHDHLQTQILTTYGETRPFESWDEAINGRALNEHRELKKVDMSTSAGAPWCDFGMDKTDLIDDSREDWLVCKPQFTTLLDRVEQQLSDGNVAGYTATANSKDELRDHQRVDAKKTRLFCATPIHHNVMFRKYYGRWIRAYKSLPFDIGMHAMGTDVFGSDWNDLYNYLMSPPSPSNERRPVFLAGDFSRFDTSHSGWKMRHAFRVAGATNPDKKMSDALAMSISRFGLRYGDREFRVPAGLPSGCQMTTPINCILNTLIWITVWRKLTGGDLKSFMANTRLVVYGDDVVLGIDEQSPYFKFLQPSKIVSVMAELGYEFGSNDNEPLRWQPLNEITFLKRRFVLDKYKIGVVHAPRPLDEIYTQLMWRRSEPTLESQQCCFYAFAMEIGQHDENISNKAYLDLLEAIRISKSELLRKAISTINAKSMITRAHNKQLQLSDIARLRQMFWRLW